MDAKLEALKRIKEERNLSDAEIARLAGISHAAVSRWWSGQRDIGMGAFDKLRTAFPELLHYIKWG